MILYNLAMDNYTLTAKFKVQTHLPEYLPSLVFLKWYSKDQKSMPDSVGICLIFS